MPHSILKNRFDIAAGYASHYHPPTPPAWWKKFERLADQIAISCPVRMQRPGKTVLTKRYKASASYTNYTAPFTCSRSYTFFL